MSNLSTEDRESFRDNVRRFLGAHAEISSVRSFSEHDRPYDPELLRSLVELGLFELMASEQQGGLGGGARDMVAMLEELGSTLAPLPVLGNLVVAPFLFAQVEEPSVSAKVNRIRSGEATVALAGNAAFVPVPDVNMQLEYDSNCRLTGCVSMVLDGVYADLTLIGFEKDESTDLYLVEKGHLSQCEALSTNDPGLRLASLHFDRAPCIKLPKPSELILSQSHDMGLLAVAALQVGGARAIFETTMQYLKDRYQFGRPIGSFQAVKHIAADLFVELESATSALRSAAEQFDSAPSDCARSLALTAFTCSDVFMEIAAQAIQLHGGIAYTREHCAHLYWRRARSLAAMYGNSDGHRERYLSTWEEAAQ